MKVYVDTVVTPHPLADTVRRLAAGASHHQLAANADEAELVLLCGPFARHPERLLEHPLLERFPSKCAVYTEDDFFSPLSPGVYTSPRRGPSSLAGRVRSQAFATSYGPHANAEVLAAGRRAGAAPRPQPRLLCSFEGTLSSRLRRRLLSLAVDPAEVLLADTAGAYSHFDHGRPGREVGQRRYVETMLASRFVLCPRGVGTGTLRLFEAMSLGVAPVLLSDRYVLPRGPAWDDFLLRIPERRVGSVVAILRSEAGSDEERGRRARQEWQAWFSPEVIFDRLVDAAAEARAAAAPLAPLFRLAVPAQTARFRAERWARRRLGGALRRGS